MKFSCLIYLLYVRQLFNFSVGMRGFTSPGLCNTWIYGNTRLGKHMCMGPGKYSRAPIYFEYVSSESTYIRWGKTSCPGNGTDLVYQGVAGGGDYSQPGSAVNHLCLPLDPQYGEYFEDAQQEGGAVYGTEYQLAFRSNYMKFFPDIEYSRALLYNDVPCAVCQVTRSTVVMVPAKNTCMDGWTLEYKGLLVSGRFTHVAATEYICLDDQPETVVGGAADQNEKLLHFVEGRCGSLPCPPYVDGRELTCAVCTK